MTIVTLSLSKRGFPAAGIKNLNKSFLCNIKIITIGGFFNE